MSQPRFGRMIPAMVTPFDENRELDLDKAQALAARLVDGGSDSLIINGTTGESPTVFYPQKMELFRAVVEAVGDRVPVIANVGDNCTADTVGFARDVADRVIFMADGLIVEEGTPEEVFTSSHERTQSFLGRYGDGYGSLKN